MRVRVRMFAAVALLAENALGQDGKPRPDADGVYPVWMGVRPAKLLHGTPVTAPDDPSLSKSKHVCALRVVMGSDSKPGSIERLRKAASPFDQVAIAAVQQSQFEAGTSSPRKHSSRWARRPETTKC